MSFEVVVAVDDNWAISRKGEIPWAETHEGRDDAEWFRQYARGAAIVCGRGTYDKLCRAKFQHSTHMVSRAGDSFTVALGRALSTGARVIIAGGAGVYEEALRHNPARVHITHINGDFDGDQHFPAMCWLPRVRGHTCTSVRRERTWGRITLVEYLDERAESDSRRAEQQYLAVLEQLLTAPLQPSTARGGQVMTRSMFGVMQRLALRGETTAEYTAGMFPLFTTKHVSFNNILREFQWFMRGDANTEWLTAHGVRIWEANTTREYLDWRGLNEYAPGETGPIYGHQWRGTSLSSWRIDQVQEVIDAVRGGVPSRRMIVSAWNVSDLHKMCLPPCHVMYQFYIRDGVLSCMLTQRSSDYFLAGNYNIATCALFVYMICALTGATPGEVVWSVGDCHLYCAHEHAAREQLTREVGPCPRLVVRRAKTIEEFLASDPVLEFYEHQGRLRAPLIV